MVDIEGAEVLQLLVPNFNLKDVVKESFLEDIQKKYDGNIRVVALSMVFGEDSAEVVTLTHLIPDYEKENKVVLDVRNPDHINMMMDIIKKYRNEG